MIGQLCSQADLFCFIVFIFCVLRAEAGHQIGTTRNLGVVAVSPLLRGGSADASFVPHPLPATPAPPKMGKTSP
jgi:hypothetical protein